MRPTARSRLSCPKRPPHLKVRGEKVDVTFSALEVAWPVAVCYQRFEMEVDQRMIEAALAA